MFANVYVHVATYTIGFSTSIIQLLTCIIYLYYLPVLSTRIETFSERLNDNSRIIDVAAVQKPQTSKVVKLRDKHSDSQQQVKFLNHKLQSTIKHGIRLDSLFD